MFGLKRRKQRKTLEEFPPADPELLLRQQSVGAAILAAMAAIVICNYLWVLSTDLFGRIFPWLSMIQGLVIGLAVRRMGCGFDWRFPAVAAAGAWLGAVSANFVIAMMTTSQALGVGAYQVVSNLTTMTFGVFFTETFNVVDHIYALSGAALAAFYSTRQLNRREVLALRNSREEMRR